MYETYQEHPKQAKGSIRVVLAVAFLACAIGAGIFLITRLVGKPLTKEDARGQTGIVYDSSAVEGGWDNLSPEEIAEKLNEKVAEGMINISMNTAPYFENGKAEGNVMIVNEAINNYPQQVEFIRNETGAHFHIEVAAYPEWHPQARSPKDDLEAFARKVKAGANSAITQYFYNADAYFHFVDESRALGVDVPIIPGIMPIAGFTKLARFSDACGAELPRWMRKKFESFGDDAESIRAFGLDVVTELCERLLKGGAPGLHFYAMNQAALTTEICRRLG